MLSIDRLSCRNIVGLVSVLLVTVLASLSFAYDWDIQTVDSEGDVGTHTSIALDSDGFPRISYRDETNGDLKYAFMDTVGWHREVVDSSGDVDGYTSLSVDESGCPHISYYDAINKDLKYARWEAGWIIQTVDSVGDVGTRSGPYASLALDDSGYPHISYYDATNGDLKYAHIDDGTWDIQTVDSAGDVGQFSSLALDDSGYPHISYCGQWEHDLKYAHLEGSEWSICSVEHFDIGGIGGNTSLALDGNGFPRISYMANKELRYAYHDGSHWHVAHVTGSHSLLDWVDSASLALDAEYHPHISLCHNSFTTAQTADLEYAYCDDPEGDWYIEVIDTGEGDILTGWWNSLAIDDSGNAHISYYECDLNGEVGYLKYARTTSLPVTEDPLRPLRVELVEMWPNPASGMVHARVMLPEGQQPVSLALFDVLGRQLTSLPLPGSTQSGDPIVTFRLPESVPNGQYFLVLKGFGQRHVVPITIMK